jgi:hypothetical protein
MHWFRIFLAGWTTLSAILFLFGLGNEYESDSFLEYLLGCIAIGLVILVIAALCVLTVVGVHNLWQWALP